MSKLFENQTATLTLTNATEREWVGGRGVVSLAGVPDGLTVTLWANVEGIGYAAVSDGSLVNTTGQFSFDLPECLVKGVVTGTAGSSSDISCAISGYLSS